MRILLRSLGVLVQSPKYGGDFGFVKCFCASFVSGLEENCWVMSVFLGGGNLFLEVTAKVFSCLDVESLELVEFVSLLLS